MTNVPTGPDHTWVDVDYIVFQDSDSSSSPSLPTLFADNTDKGFSYLPAAVWESVNGNNSLGNSLSRTQSSAAKATFTFVGESVALYGRIGPSNGAFICSVDDGANTTHTAYSQETANQQVLCFANNLKKEAEHTLSVWNQPSGNNAWLEVDFAQVWGDDACVASISSLLFH